MNSKKLIRKLYKQFPTSIAKKYHDYVGLMVSHLRENTNSIILCLDVSRGVIDKALEIDADLIISHHPFIYGKKKDVLKDDFKKNMYDILDSHNIPVYSFHTNFDEAKGGMNDTLAGLLELNEIYQPTTCLMGRIGYLSSPLPLNEFIKYALDKLNLDYGYYLGNPNKFIKKVGIVGGSGSSFYKEFYKEGCDVYLTGDTPYHIRKEIIEKDLAYINIDHEVEKAFIESMKKILFSIDNSLNIYIVNDVKQGIIVQK